jgi:hypothetical protein
MKAINFHGYMIGPPRAVTNQLVLQTIAESRIRNAARLLNFAPLS